MRSCTKCGKELPDEMFRDRSMLVSRICRKCESKYDVERHRRCRKTKPKNTNEQFLGFKW